MFRSYALIRKSMNLLKNQVSFAMNMRHGQPGNANQEGLVAGQILESDFPYEYQ